MNCTKCEGTAVFEYVTSPHSSMFFCHLCVPGFLRSPEGKLLLKPIAVPEPVAKTTKKKSTATTPEPVVEEVPVEEAPAEAEPDPAE